MEEIEGNLIQEIFNIILAIDGWSISCEIALKWMSLDHIMFSQHWSRWWFDTIREQAITWTNVDLYLGWYMAYIDHNE